MAKRDEVAKLRRQIKALQKRGYQFPKGFTPTPGINLYEVASYINPVTGQIMTGIQRRAMERSIAARKAAETRRASRMAEAILSEEGVPGYNPPYESTAILNNIYNAIDTWRPLDEWIPKKNRKNGFDKIKERDKNKLKALLDNAVRSEGELAVAQRLNANAEHVNTLVNRILYGGSGYDADGGHYMQGELTELAGILQGSMLNIEQSKELEEQIESFMPA